MSDVEQIRTAVKVADKLAQVNMKHNFVLLQKVTLDDSEDKFNLIPDDLKEFRLRVVAIGPGTLLSDKDTERGWARAPMSVQLGDLVQFTGGTVPVRVGNEDMAVIKDTQVLLSVTDSRVH